MHPPDRPCAGRPVGPVRAALGGAAALGSEPARAHARWAAALFRLGCALLGQAGRALDRVLSERAVDGLHQHTFDQTPLPGAPAAADPGGPSHDAGPSSASDLPGLTWTTPGPVRTQVPCSGTSAVPCSRRRRVAVPGRRARRPRSSEDLSGSGRSERPGKMCTRAQGIRGACGTTWGRVGRACGRRMHGVTSCSS